MPWRTGALPADVRAVFWLQFGHGVDAVENLITSPASKSITRLQCGHGVDAVENEAEQRPVNQYENSFNAATALMPWRTQWTRPPRSRSPRFNAATALMPWRTGLRRRIGGQLDVL